MNYTLAQVAEILNCTYQTVYKLVKRGEIKAFRVGSDFRVKEENLNEYMNRGE